MTTVTVLTRHNAMADSAKSPALRRGFVACAAVFADLVDAGPGLAAAEHAAKGAALNAQAVGGLERDRRIVGAAGIRIEDPAAPLVLAGLHVDQNLLTVLVGLLVDGVAAEIGAALFDPHLAFLLLRQPHAER